MARTADPKTNKGNALVSRDRTTSTFDENDDDVDDELSSAFDNNDKEDATKGRGRYGLSNIRGLGGEIKPCLGPKTGDFVEKPCDEAIDPIKHKSDR